MTQGSPKEFELIRIYAFVMLCRDIILFKLDESLLLTQNIKIFFSRICTIVTVMTFLEIVYNIFVDLGNEKNEYGKQIWRLIFFIKFLKSTFYVPLLRKYRECSRLVILIRTLFFPKLGWVRIADLNIE